MSDGVTLDLDGTEVTITNPDKVYFAKTGHTKLDVVRFYESISGPLLTALGGRPLLLERYPEGAAGKSFFQKRVPKSAPDWLQTTVVSTPNGTTSDALVAADLAHIAWAVNLGCIGFHVWPYHAATQEFTDELRIDLDPSPGIGFDQLREGAVATKEFFDELGMASHIKTSGSRGLHIYVTLESKWDGFEVRAAAVAFARELERRHPDLITAKWWKEERGKRVFVDFNQNAPHKTVFGAWCIRPRVGAQVSTPITWDELPTIDPDTLTIDTVADRVAAQGNPWADVNDEPQSITTLLEMSAKDMADGLMDAPWPPVYPKMPNEPPRVAPSRAKKTDTVKD
ncbi:non-homologous end-joining DNA ligase [Antrihabitans cavernicola]|uniref:ATP-dependent DNA ligase n=1 Tax=Antrihabitans cavernicola TaxID=2495913 RepID=A0A5A7SE11_9NOCA|nr:non-homologous end-joining DNA ligase [Spelaeibacter cavernicola]KAA0023609.1 ATP-dependent DNA ligase [Spelaeibacter cavernicola]